MPRMRVGVIGAGVAGLTVARRLQDAGSEVFVLDKGRGVRGRASTRREETRTFDHGAQYFTIREPAFRDFLDSHVSPESYAVWSAQFARHDGDRLHPDHVVTTRYVGVPGMSALCRALAAPLEVRTQTRVTRLLESAGGWRLEDAEGRTFGPFDWVVATAPPLQSAAILAAQRSIADPIQDVKMSPCFSLMIVPAGTAAFSADGIRCEHSVLGWVANDHSKPGRKAGPALVIQSNHAWAEAHREDPLPQVSDLLKATAEAALGVDLREPKRVSLHRWLFAAPVKSPECLCYVDFPKRLAACGDWCVAGKIEGAFLSGDACARSILSR